MKLKKGGNEVSYSIEAFSDMLEGVPNPALNADPPIEVGDRILAINGVKVSTQNEIVQEIGKVDAGTVLVIQMQRTRHDPEVVLQAQEHEVKNREHKLLQQEHNMKAAAERFRGVLERASKG